MSDPRPLTPPEVRELLRASQTNERLPSVLSGHFAVDGWSAIISAAVSNPAIRATLERYAELADEFGEAYEATLRESERRLDDDMHEWRRKG